MEGELLFVAAADVDVEVSTGFVADTISLYLILLCSFSVAWAAVACQEEAWEE